MFRLVNCDPIHHELAQIVVHCEMEVGKTFARDWRFVLASQPLMDGCVTDEEWLQRVAEAAEVEHLAVGCPEGDDEGERAWRGWAGGMRAGSVSDSDMDVLVTGRRRRVVTVVQWHAAACARMIIALGWVMHDRMARVSDWGVT